MDEIHKIEETAETGGIEKTEEFEKIASSKFI